MKYDLDWDERKLGANDEFVRKAQSTAEDTLDSALGLQSISIRLPKELIEAYKFIASHHGIGYQPLMRDILQRFVKEGLKEVLSNHYEMSQQAEERIEAMHKAV